MVIWSPDKRKKNNISFCSASRVVLSLGSGQVELAFDTVQELKNIDEITDSNAFIKAKKLDLNYWNSP